MTANAPKSRSIRIIDGIEVKGPEADRINAEVMREAGVSTLAMLGGTALFVGVIAGIVATIFALYVRWLPIGWRVGINVGVAVAASVVWGRLLLRLRRRRIREALGRRGFDLCLSCGYWLKNLGPEQPRCPECGAERVAHAVADMDTVAHTAPAAAPPTRASASDT